MSAPSPAPAPAPIPAPRPPPAAAPVAAPSPAPTATASITCRLLMPLRWISPSSLICFMACSPGTPVTVAIRGILP
ncbi:MAG: hypothetical protein DMG74_00905 [Acidobacteria bacterium]|nr:MAG: hypothetical protein DMG75_06820 [Acidobacteriota bacterium]PYX67231.1 MAG: hypothetical protein DMG74_00905 [Acidobacteriota bacterium]